MMASMLPVRARGVWCETYHSKEVADSILGFLVPHGFVRALQRFVRWVDGAPFGGASYLSGRCPSRWPRAGWRSHACRAPSAPSYRISPSSSPGRRAFCSEFALHYMGLMWTSRTLCILEYKAARRRLSRTRRRSLECVVRTRQYGASCAASLARPAVLGHGRGGDGNGH